MSPKGSKNDFEKRYFDALDENFRDLKEDIKEVKSDIKDVKGDIRNVAKGGDGVSARLIKVEDKVFPAQGETIKQLPPFFRDPQVLSVIKYVVGFLIIVAIIFAAVLGVNLPSGLF